MVVTPGRGPGVSSYALPEPVLVTGGTGFIGKALVRELVRRKIEVRVFDNDSRGSRDHLRELGLGAQILTGDIRDPRAVDQAVKGAGSVFHLAYINGTEFFYKHPDTILEVAVKGMMNVIDACLMHSVKTLVLASSSETYQNAAIVPTDESVPLVVPDVLNPRYSYGGGKIISELLALNYGRSHFDRVLIFRPHNVYGPQMGNEHVIPQFARRMEKLFAERLGTGAPPFSIQGSGKETRAFIYIDDFVEALLLMVRRGEHLNVYHLGTEEEVTIEELAHLTAACFGRTIEIVPGVLQPGSPLRRCPAIGKLRALGFAPKTSLRDGLKETVAWYRQDSQPAVASRVEDEVLGP